MENVPWHKEVRAFVQQLADALPGYEIAAEHEHSNCLLLANEKVREAWLWEPKGIRGILSGSGPPCGNGPGPELRDPPFQFKIDGHWHTWIDYDKFRELVQEYHRSGKMFTSLDYMAPTPPWAIFGADEMGFDPSDTRWYRKNRKDISGC